MARVPLISDRDASDEQGAALKESAMRRGTRLNLFRVMAHSAEASRRVSALGTFLRFDSTLPERLREAVILAVSARWRCEYERVIHERSARGLGLSDRALADLREGRVPPELDAAEASCVRYAVALASTGATPDSLVVAVQLYLNNQGLVELHLLVGYYSMLALFLNGLQVEPEAK